MKIVKESLFERLDTDWYSVGGQMEYIDSINVERDWEFDTKLTILVINYVLNNESMEDKNKDLMVKLAKEDPRVLSESLKHIGDRQIYRGVAEREHSDLDKAYSNNKNIVSFSLHKEMAMAFAEATFEYENLSTFITLPYEMFKDKVLLVPEVILRSVPGNERFMFHAVKEYLQQQEVLISGPIVVEPQYLERGEGEGEFISGY